MRALIAAGAPLEACNKDKDTVLHCAALAGHLDIVTYAWDSCLAALPYVAVHTPVLHRWPEMYERFR